MPESNSLLYILIILNIVVLIVIILIRNSFSKNVHSRILEIEKNKNFELKVSILKSAVEEDFENKLREKVSSSKQYYIQDAIRRSASVTKGKVIEHFAPFMMPGDLTSDEMVFIGSPIDLISFTNIDKEIDISIDFLEIKSGNSSLNKKQKLIRDAIFNKRFYYKTVHLK